MLNKPPFDPSRIRKCKLINDEGIMMIQFIGIADRHKMICGNDGELRVETLHEEGLDYNYDDPCSLDEAIDILKQNTYHNHADMIRLIEFHT
jgi:hypothetical protein